MKDLIGSFVAGLFVVAVVVSGAIAANAASLTHSYDFNNSFSDTLGNGADMVSGGGVRGATGLSFGKNEGPIFSRNSIVCYRRICNRNAGHARRNWLIYETY